ncbi:type II toxin-antitoxin system ParD family antitoxin [Neorhizobium sp. NCHU2750]|uniref:type II toxin-antitoxin system ParD family antitoxin n=1 Tax=Neorhizobium sp. NCHU2750 TaxID=1825976 RepID=UPI000E721BB3|nr:antitoxin ParD [Neorhizobium sp. NCHU2750]
MAHSSDISLDDEQQKLIDRLVRAGRYHGANDVIAMGLKLIEERERQAEAFTSELEQAVDTGLASGPATLMENGSELIAAFRRPR